MLVVVDKKTHAVLRSSGYTSNWQEAVYLNAKSSVFYLMRVCGSITPLSDCGVSVYSMSSMGGSAVFLDEYQATWHLLQERLLDVVKGIVEQRERFRKNYREKDWEHAYGKIHRDSIEILL